LVREGVLEGTLAKVLERVIVPGVSISAAATAAAAAADVAFTAASAAAGDRWNGDAVVDGNVSVTCLNAVLCFCNAAAALLLGVGVTAIIGTAAEGSLDRGTPAAVPPATAVNGNDAVTCLNAVLCCCNAAAPSLSGVGVTAIIGTAAEGSLDRGTPAAVPPATAVNGIDAVICLNAILCCFNAAAGSSFDDAASVAARASGIWTDISFGIKRSNENTSDDTRRKYAEKERLQLNSNSSK
jgi:hypothetical protein